MASPRGEWRGRGRSWWVPDQASWFQRVGGHPNPRLVSVSPRRVLRTCWKAHVALPGDQVSSGNGIGKSWSILFPPFQPLLQ